MQITKTVNLKIVSISPASIRILNADHKRGENTFKPGYQITLAAVDTNGRFISRTTLGICDGRLSNSSEDLGELPSSLAEAISNALSEIEKAITPIIESGKISL